MPVLARSTCDLFYSRLRLASIWERSSRAVGAAVIDNTQHRYSRKLIQAVPIAGRRRRSERRDLANEEITKFGAARRLCRAAAYLPRGESGSCRTGIALILAAGDRFGHRGRACVAPPRGRRNPLPLRCRAAFQPRNALHRLAPVEARHFSGTATT
jgi:hypothetical protein